MGSGFRPSNKRIKGTQHVTGSIVITPDGDSNTNENFILNSDTGDTTDQIFQVQNSGV